MSSNIKLNTRKNSYDPAKYESLGTVHLSMSVNVSFEAPAAKPSGFFGTAPKPPPVNKQQKLTETQNSMITSLKKELVNHAPEGTEMLIDVKIGHMKNIGHPPEYILSMSASATAVRKVSQASMVPAAPVEPMLAPAQPMLAPAPAPIEPMLAPAPAQPMLAPAQVPAPQMGGKNRNKKRARKTRKHRR
jgi:hypothetical protein